VAASVVAVAGLAFVARTAAVELGETALWPGNPSVLSAHIMSDVGQAAARGEEPNEQTLARLEQLAAKEPLTAQPFLVHGAMAARTGDFDRAEKLLAIARQRAPRSAAARYLMGDLYLRTNRPVAAMAEMAVLNRLLATGSLQLAPSLAAYARVPGSIPQIKTILESYPELEEPLLAQMSTDTANTEAVLRLASPRIGDGRAPVWQGMLLSNLVARGQYQKALATWRRLSGVSGGAGELNNPQFDASNAPPPFNWRFAEGAGAVVQPSSGGLEVVYFGRDNLAFAEQVVLLPPGRHRLAMSVSGSFADDPGIAWSS
jgi:tetratricopeptide (TPR) repeat protein